MPDGHDYEIEVGGKTYEMHSEKPLTPADIQGVVKRFKGAAFTGQSRSKPTEAAQTRVPKRQAQGPQSSAVSPFALKGPTTIGPPHPEAKPNLLQQAGQALGHVLGYPQGMLNALAMQPIAGHSLSEALHGATRKPLPDKAQEARDRASVARLQKMNVFQRATALEGQVPIDPNLGRPAAQGQEEAGASAQFGAGHTLMKKAGEMGTDPVTYILSPAGKLLPKAARVAMTAAFGTQMGVSGAQKLTQAWKTGDKSLGVEGLIDTAFAAMSAHHLKGDVMRESDRAETIAETIRKHGVEGDARLRERLASRYHVKPVEIEKAVNRQAREHAAAVAREAKAASENLPGNKPLQTKPRLERKAALTEAAKPEEKPVVKDEATPDRKKQVQRRTAIRTGRPVEKTEPAKPEPEKTDRQKQAARRAQARAAAVKPTTPKTETATGSKAEAAPPAITDDLVREVAKAKSQQANGFITWRHVYDRLKQDHPNLSREEFAKLINDFHKQHASGDNQKFEMEYPSGKPKPDDIFTHNEPNGRSIRYYGVWERPTKETPNATQEGLQQGNAVGEHPGNGQGGTQAGSGGSSSVPPTATVQKQEGEVAPTGPFTGARNAITEAERAARGAPDVERQDYRTPTEFVAAGHKALEAHEEGYYHTLAEEVATKPRVLSGEEVGMLAAGRQKIKASFNALSEKLDAAIKSGDKAGAAALQAELDAVEKQFDLNDQALVKGGREQSMAFNARKMILYDNGDVGETLAYAKRKAGRPLTAQETEAFTELAKAHKALQEEHAKVVEQVTKLEAERAAETLSKIAQQDKRAGRLKDLRVERDSLVQELKNHFKKQTLNAGPKLAVDVSITLGKLAINYIREGYFKLEDVVKKIQEDFPNVSDRQVHDALSGYGRDAKAPTEDEVKLKIAELKKEAKLISQTEDEPGIDTRVPKEASRTDNPHIISMRDELKEYHKQREILEGIDALQRTLAANEIEPSKTKKNLPKSAEETHLEELKAEYRRRQAALDAKAEARNKIDLEKQGVDTRTLRRKPRVMDEEEKNLRDELAQYQKQRTVRDQIDALQEKLDKGQIDRRLTKKDRPRSEDVEKLAALKKEYAERQNEMTRLDDLRTKLDLERKGVETRLDNPKREMSPEEKDLRQKISNERKVRDLKAQIADLEEQVKTGKFKEPVRVEPKEIDPRIKALQSRKAILEAKRRNALEGLKPKTFIDRVVDMGRAMKLAGIGVFAKLGGASVWAAPVETLANALSVVPGKFKVKGQALADVSAREGRFSLTGEGKFYRGTFSRQAIKNSMDTFRQGFNAIDAEAGAPSHGGDFSSLPGRLHGAVKSFIQTGEFERAYHYRMEKIAQEYKKAGKLLEFDPNDPDIYTQVGYGAAMDAQSIKLQGDNAAASWLNSVVKTLETSKKAPQAAKLTAAFVRTLVPITRVPLNYLGKAIQMTGAGVPEGVARQVWASLQKEPMSEAQASKIIQAYKYGGMGMVAAYIGLAQPAWFKSAGFFPAHQGGTKPNKDSKGREMNPSELEIGGVRVPHLVAHSPFLEAIQFWATVRRGIDQQKPLKAAGEASKGFLQQAPGLESMTNIYQAATGEGYDPAGAFGEYTRGMVEPQIIAEIAKYQDLNAKGIPTARKTSDPKNAAASFGNKFRANIPGLRKTLPLAGERSGSRRSSLSVPDPGATIERRLNRLTRVPGG